LAEWLSELATISVWAGVPSIGSAASISEPLAPPRRPQIRWPDLIDI
jgi:hypothetical protein